MTTKKSQPQSKVIADKKCKCIPYARCMRCVRMEFEAVEKYRVKLRRRIKKLKPDYAHIPREDVLDILDNKKI